MTIKTSFAKTFGVPSQGAADSSTTEREPSKFWLNVGLNVGEGDDARFVSLPMGIALDNMKPIAIRGSNADYNAFTAARNDLMTQLQAAAESLQPGEEAILALEVQLRRVNDAVEAPAVDETNRYSIQLDVKR